MGEEKKVKLGGGGGDGDDKEPETCEHSVW